MSTSTDAEHTHTDSVPAGNAPGSEHEHPSDLVYVKVAAFLAVLTAMEVSTYFIFDEPWTAVNVVALLTMMVIKFGTVAAFFMHLRFDSPLFRRVFIAGLILAVVVYIIVFLTFEFFEDDYFKYVRG
jgi:cytochrome c oxidase subunit IV